jgi:hypothetical protein
MQAVGPRAYGLRRNGGMILYLLLFALSSVREEWVMEVAGSREKKGKKKLKQKGGVSLYRAMVAIVGTQ